MIVKINGANVDLENVKQVKEFMYSNNGNYVHTQVALWHHPKEIGVLTMKETQDLIHGVVINAHHVVGILQHFVM
jgi:hypothetical protein